MKILVLCQYYYPEPFRISDICEALVQRGHEVMVVTGTPNYPMGEIYDGYRDGEKTDEILNGVKVHHCPVIPRKTDVIHRFLNYYSYSIESSKYIKNLDNDFDVVFVNQLSPVMMANAGIKYKKKTKKKLVLYCLDLWPESLEVGGIKRGSIIYRFYYRISNKIYQRADKILVSSRLFAECLKDNFGIEGSEYLPQYAEDVFSPDVCRKEPNGTLDLMFAGNLGTAQNLTTVIEAAKLTVGEAIHWHIVGDGLEYQNLKHMSQGLDNITFYGRQPLEKMPEFYSKADAMIVTMQKNPTLSLTLPGKVQTYMAAGKPIIGAIDGETKLVIEDALCGVCGPAEDVGALVDNVLRFAQSSEIDKMGARSIAYYQNNFSKKAFIEKLEKELVSQVGGK